MSFRVIIVVLIGLFSFPSYSQTAQYGVHLIPTELKKNANSVIRLEKERINIERQDRMSLVRKRVVTVLNENGNRDIDAFIHYDPSDQIKEIRAVILDAYGNEIETIKERDFQDRSAVDGISLFTDTRLKFLEYTPVSYPYTVVFDLEFVTSNTAFIPTWYATNGYHSSTVLSDYEVLFNPYVNLRYDISDSQEVFEIDEGQGFLKLVASNVEALVPEAYAPSYQRIAPHVSFALQKFSLEGVYGEASTWKEFGKWMDDNLLKETISLSESTRGEITMLTDNLTSNEEKARKVYQYVQDKTRYVSVQIGIGGWKPMLASEVDRLGYGDCKALTNYTRALLAAANVPSYYAVLHSKKEKQSFPKDFVSMQGNHAILAIPNEEDLIWLECTSQKIPFGFIGGTNDDRDVLIITPEGGEIAHTAIYDHHSNLQNLSGEVHLLPDGSLKADVKIVSGGLQYNSRYAIENDSDKEKKDYYYDFWSHLSNMDIESIALQNDKEAVQFTERIKFNVENYASLPGDEMMVALNILNRATYIPTKYSDRKYPLEIDRGYTDRDEVKVYLPEGYEITSLPEVNEISSPFGRYKVAVEDQGDGTLLYRREIERFEGVYPKEVYKEFRNFLRKIARADKKSIILRKKI